ncbi:hypothetical protein BZA77DRAFT_345339 [Pyronema omphalodes]|nr:hypothetical protein BZA77DRAFT_345339 [Pyronema omphalodes]
MYVCEDERVCFIGGFVNLFVLSDVSTIRLEMVSALRKIPYPERLSLLLFSHQPLFIAASLTCVCAESGLWVGYGLWVMGYGLWVMGYGLWVMGYGLWVTGYGLWVMGWIHVTNGPVFVLFLVFVS